MFLRLATVQKHIGPAIVVVDATVEFAVVIAAAVVVVVVHFRAIGHQIFQP